MELSLENWRAWRHLQDLIRFRKSGQILEAGKDWLDKEISDITGNLAAEKNNPPGSRPEDCGFKTN